MWLRALTNELVISIFEGVELDVAREVVRVISGVHEGVVADGVQWDAKYAACVVVRVGAGHREVAVRRRILEAQAVFRVVSVKN